MNSLWNINVGMKRIVLFLRNGNGAESKTIFEWKYGPGNQSNSIFSFHSILNKPNFFGLVEWIDEEKMNWLLLAAPQLLRNCPRSTTNSTLNSLSSNKAKTFALLMEELELVCCSAPCCFMNQLMLFGCVLSLWRSPWRLAAHNPHQKRQPNINFIIHNFAHSLHSIQLISLIVFSFRSFTHLCSIECHSIPFISRKGGPQPFKFNQFSINFPILKEKVDGIDEFDWAGPFNLALQLLNKSISRCSIALLFNN